MKPKPMDTLCVWDDGSAHIQSATNPECIYMMQARLLNGIYTVTHCDCLAYERGVQCWHIKTFRDWLDTHDIEKDGLK